MRNKWIYDRVLRLVQRYQTRDPDELIRLLNIHLRYMETTHSLLGMYRVILKNRFIFLPNNVGSLRKTVLAHELGHDQLHRKECIKGVGFHESRIFHSADRYEMEANIFAAHLLIPDEDVLSMIANAENDRALADTLGVDIHLLNLKISEMAKMKLPSPDSSRLQPPDAKFLKHYRPMNDDWSDC